MAVRNAIVLATVLVGSASATAAQPLAAEPATAAGTDAAAPLHAPAARDEALRREAEGAAGLRIVVSLAERRLRLMDGTATLLDAPVGIGRADTLRHADRTWTFATPPGRHRVRGKAANPVWVPPDWHYVEAAQRRGVALARLRRGADAPLHGGGRLRVRGDRVIYVDAGGTEVPLPEAEELVFGDTLYVPPLGTAQRRIPGELGAYKLDLGDGYLLHGTRDEGSVGSAATHGCLRLRAADLALLFARVPVETPVYVY